MNIIFLKKSVLASGLLLFGVLWVSAQTNAQPSDVAISTPSYKAENAGWLVNLDEAYAKSKETGRPIMANFTGSDWCGWCKRLTANVFIHEAFKQWAEKNVVLLELDFPRGKFIPENIKGQNASLQQAFQVQGFPTIWVFRLDKNEATNQYSIESLGKTGYMATVEEFTSGIDQMIKK